MARTTALPVDEEARTPAPAAAPPAPRPQPTPAARPTAAPSARAAVPVAPEPESAIEFIHRDAEQMGSSPQARMGTMLSGGSGTDVLRDYEPRRLVQPGGIFEAVDAGLRWISDTIGASGTRNTGGAVPERAEPNTAAFARNEGRPTPQELQEIDSAIDPRGELSPAERSVARLYGAYNYYLARNEPQKAREAAASILMHTRDFTMRAGAIAQAQWERGEREAAMRTIIRAYDEIPDGRRLEIAPQGEGAMLTLWDDQGRPTPLGMASVDDFMRITTGMQNGSVWLQQMAGMTRPPTERQRENEAARPEGGSGRGTQTEREAAARREQREQELARIDAADAPDEHKQAARRVIEARHGYESNARENRWREGSMTRQLENLLDEFSEKVGEGGGQVAEATRINLEDATRGLIIGNAGISLTRAFTVSRDMFDPGTDVTVQEDGRVKVGSHPPLWLDAQTLNELRERRDIGLFGVTRQAPEASAGGGRERREDDAEYERGRRLANPEPRETAPPRSAIIEQEQAREGGMIDPETGLPRRR